MEFISIVNEVFNWVNEDGDIKVMQLINLQLILTINLNVINYNLGVLIYI